MPLIALGHRKRVGKDTIAEILVKQAQEAGMPARRVSFAAKLKETAYELFSWAGIQEPAYYETHDKQTFYPDLGLTYRDLLISLGCKMREIHPDCWAAEIVKRASIEPGLTVISDLRFPNEMRLVAFAGGHMVRVIRPQVPDTDDPADTPLEKAQFDQTFINDSANLDALYEQVLHEIFIPLRVNNGW